MLLSLVEIQATLLLAIHHSGNIQLYRLMPVTIFIIPLPSFEMSSSKYVFLSKTIGLLNIPL